MTLKPKLTAKPAPTVPPYSDYHTSNMVLKAVGAGGVRKGIIESKASAGVTHFIAPEKLGDKGEAALLKLYDFLAFTLGVDVHVVDERHLRVNSQALAFAVQRSKEAGTFEFSPIWNGDLAKTSPTPAKAVSMKLPMITDLVQSGTEGKVDVVDVRQGVEQYYADPRRTPQKERWWVEIEVEWVGDQREGLSLGAGAGGIEAFTAMKTPKNEWRRIFPDLDDYTLQRIDNKRGVITWKGEWTRWGEPAERPIKEQTLHQWQQTHKPKSKVVEEGDVFYTSWGYDQTQIDFIAVMSVSESGKTAMCQLMLKEPAKDDPTRVQPAFVPQLRAQYPTGGKKLWGDKKFRMKIEKDSDGNVYLRGSYPYIKGDPRHGKRLDTFFKHKEGDTYYETPYGLGH